MERSGRSSILLIEDDNDVRQLIRTFFEKRFVVHEAANSREAMDHLSYPIDLAIIDYLLPDGNGLDLLKRIRDIKPSLPAIIITAYSSESLAIKALRAGATDYIRKPISLSYLASKVSEILGQKTDLCEEHSHPSEGREDFIMEVIRAYIEERYMEPDLTFEKIVSLSNMSKSKFCHFFKKRFGMTFTDYLNNIRIKNALDILRNPDLNISEIAHFVGFGSLVHFERVFREIHGMSPREYRKNLSQQKFKKRQ